MLKLLATRLLMKVNIVFRLMLGDGNAGLLNDQGGPSAHCFVDAIEACASRKVRPSIANDVVNDEET